MRGIGDIADPHLEEVSQENQLSLLDQSQLVLLIGDLALSSFEDELSAVWPECLDRKERAFRVISAFWRILQKAATHSQANVILMDLGPNLGPSTVLP